MSRLSIPLKIIVLLVFTVALIPSAGAQEYAAHEFLHVVNEQPSAPGTLSQYQAAEEHGNVVAGVYELSGHIVGHVTVDSRPMIIFQDGDVSLELSVRQSLLDSSSWMDAGEAIRVLIQAGSATSPSDTVLLSAAPEDATVALEKQLSAQAAAPQRYSGRDSVSPTSRSATFGSRAPVQWQPVAGLSDAASAIFPAYRRAVAQLNPRLEPTTVDTITKSILYYADRYQLDPRMVIAMVVAESGFDPNCRSRTGAAGLGQLMPQTAAELGVRDPMDPAQNIGAAVQILSSHIQQYGGAAPYGVVPLNTLLLTMAAYNAGSGAVKKYGGVPPFRETQVYVRRVDKLYRQLCGDN